MNACIEVIFIYICTMSRFILKEALLQSLFLIEDNCDPGNTILSLYYFSRRDFSVSVSTDDDRSMYKIWGE